MTREFLAHIHESAERFQALVRSRVVVFHHNDTDGLCSGAILFSMLDRLGIPFSGYCLEKTYTEAFQKVFEDSYLPPDAVVLITDFGSGILPELEQLNKSEREIFVLDHHQIQDTPSVHIHLVNPLEFGINGSLECSASIVCALFSRALGEENQDLSALGCLGAFGDGHAIESGDNAFHHSVLHQAEECGMAKRDGSLEIYSAGKFQHAKNLKSALDVLGSYAYFQKGPDIALKGLRDGFDSRYHAIAEDFQRKYESEMVDLLKFPLQTVGQFIQHFNLDDHFLGAGVKTVGLACERFSTAPNTDPSRIIVGFQRVPASIPGLGDLDLTGEKVSFRFPPALWKKVEQGQFPDFTRVVRGAAEKAHGLVDGCHRHAAALLLPLGNREEFLACLDNVISAWKISHSRS